MYKTNTLDWFI